MDAGGVESTINTVGMLANSTKKALTKYFHSFDSWKCCIMILIPDRGNRGYRLKYWCDVDESIIDQIKMNMRAVNAKHCCLWLTYYTSSMEGWDDLVCSYATWRTLFMTTPYTRYLGFVVDGATSDFNIESTYFVSLLSAARAFMQDIIGWTSQKQLVYSTPDTTDWSYTYKHCPIINAENSGYRIEGYDNYVDIKHYNIVMQMVED